MSFFGDLERFASDLYPYRSPIAVVAVVVIAAVTAFAYRSRWHQALWRHKLATAAVVALVLAAAVPTGWYTLSPLWERSYLEEATPLGSVTVQMGPAEGGPSVTEPGQAPKGNGPSSTPAEEPFTARIAQRGEFRGADEFHFGRGQALLIETAPGRYTLRFESFSVRNGPDLFVYLSPDAADFGDGALNLGRLKATDGAFNYEVPAGVDIAGFRSAIVWCRQFSVLFAVAALEEIQ